MAIRSGTPRHTRNRRLVTGALVLGLHAAFIALLLRPILLPAPQPPESLILVNIPAAPPPAPEAEIPAPPEPAAQAAPPAPRKRPRPVAAPTPPIVPAPTPVAPAPSTGTETASGAAAAGTGTGAAGAGTGAGAGGSGGGGGSKPLWRSGRIEARDYPPEAVAAKASGTVIAHFEVSADGRPKACIVAQSSGNAALDRTTCRLIERRFRFHPARNADGQPIPSMAGWKQDWWLNKSGALP